MVACAGVGELSDAEDGLFGNPDVGRPGEGTVVLGRPIKFGFGDVKAEKNRHRNHMSVWVVRLKIKMFDLCHWHSLRPPGLYEGLHRRFQQRRRPGSGLETLVF